MNNEIAIDNALLRGIALENDPMWEAKAESICNMGVGCGIYGVCFAKANDKPELCGEKFKNEKY